jgi:hypothetical protein
VKGYNMTPPNFQPPSDEIIDEVIQAIDEQIAIDEADLSKMQKHTLSQEDDDSDSSMENTTSDCKENF